MGNPQNSNVQIENLTFVLQNFIPNHLGFNVGKRFHNSCLHFWNDKDMFLIIFIKASEILIFCQGQSI